MKGLTVSPGVIDADYTGEIRIMAKTEQHIINLPAGTRVAQLLLLPYIDNQNKAYMQPYRGASGFGSTDAFLLKAIKMERPEYHLTINGKIFKGILDTGADVSVIALEHWPNSWPLHPTSTALQGVGQSTSPYQSSAILKWNNDEGAQGTFQPYILPHLPVNLWGRDIMEQMGLVLWQPETPVQSFS